MDRLNTFLWILTLLVIASCSKEVPTLSEKEAETIATEVYIYGYPLVTMDQTRRVMTNVETPTEGRAPMGQFANMRKYPTAEFRDVTAPNADTLYSSAWLDLSKEPFILHVPAEPGRYYLMPMLNGWTNVFASPGIRTTGSMAGDFAITGPGWIGELPEEIKKFESPTRWVWVLGRTYCTGTPEDYEAVHKIQNEYTLTPLSSYGKSYTPPKGTVTSDVDMKTPVRDQVNSLSAASYFARLASLMKENPPADADVSMVALMGKIGLVPGQDFDIDKLDLALKHSLERAPGLGRKKIVAHAKEAGKRVNGWLVPKKAGNYGTDYLQRAYITMFGLGANLPDDAIYPATDVDAEGKSLEGSQKYVIHFQKDQLPPVNGFWSLTLYNDQFFFAANPLNRFTLSPRNTLQHNPDGSLNLYIQHQFPGNGKESNWLPAPEGKFNLMLRLYWPQKAVLDGSWNPPPVKRVE
ncbi:MAG: DUF1254 domain-containing protein [Parachlamydia sp.]|nr:DUF1254 domain-containing protein [Parachlamydia sp.]